MPRARNKAELLEFGEAQYKRLMGLVEDLSEEQRDKMSVFDNRTVKDIVAHLDAWLGLFLEWYRIGMSGEKPHIPAPGYTFKELPALNEALYQQEKDKDWATVIDNFQKKHAEVIALVAMHSDDELTTKKKYSWTGSTNLASYLASSTSSHYVWANDLISKFRKRLNLPLRP